MRCCGWREGQRPGPPPARFFAWLDTGCRWGGAVIKKARECTRTGQAENAARLQALWEEWHWRHVHSQDHPSERDRERHAGGRRTRLIELPDADACTVLAEMACPLPPQVQGAPGRRYAQERVPPADRLNFVGLFLVVSVAGKLVTVFPRGEQRTRGRHIAAPSGTALISRRLCG
jgi:hypothetical protein